VKGRVITSDPREAILDNIIGQDHVGLTIFYYPRDLSMIMTIWKWSLAYTTMEGFLLKEIFVSYYESYILKVDGEGMMCTFGALTSHEHTRTHKTPHGLDSREATTFHLTIFSMTSHKGYTQMSFFPRLQSWDSQNS